MYGDGYVSHGNGYVSHSDGMCYMVTDMSRVRDLCKEERVFSLSGTHM